MQPVPSQSVFHHHYTAYLRNLSLHPCFHDQLSIRSTSRPTPRSCSLQNAFFDLKPFCRTLLPFLILNLVFEIPSIHGMAQFIININKIKKKKMFSKVYLFFSNEVYDTIKNGKKSKALNNFSLYWDFLLMNF